MVTHAGQVCSHLYQLLEALWCSLYDHACRSGLQSPVPVVRSSLVFSVRSRMLCLQLFVLVAFLLNALSANNQA